MRTTSRKLERWELVSFRSLFLCLRGPLSSRTVQTKCWRSPFRCTPRKRSFESGLTSTSYWVRRQRIRFECSLSLPRRSGDNFVVIESALWNGTEGDGAPGGTRTPDLLVRSRSNYFAKSCQRSG